MEYQKAAAAAGVIIFRQPAGELRTLDVLMARRTALVGEGDGITGGGFVKLNYLMQQPVGTMWDAHGQAFMEGGEENADFRSIITPSQFRRRAQHLISFCVRVNDPFNNGVHACNYLGLRAREGEWAHFLAMRPGDDGERAGALFAARMRWTANIVAEDADDLLDDANANGPPYEKHISFDTPLKLHHIHELRPLGVLAWLAEQGRLW
ncbi:MAG: hypothetical protein WAX89_02240 [Alphaproteobacteria bacterium]